MTKHLIPGLLAVAGLFAVGCGPTAPATNDQTKPSGSKPHSHADGGVAGGALAEWGEEEYHAEFTVDHNGEATVYILDGTAKKVAPIDAKNITLSLKENPPVAVTLDAKPQEGDPAGKSSRFVGKHDALKAEKEFRGSISGKAGGKNYSGDFEEKPAGKK